MLPRLETTYGHPSLQAMLALQQSVILPLPALTRVTCTHSPWLEGEELLSLLLADQYSQSTREFTQRFAVS